MDVLWTGSDADSCIKFQGSNDLTNWKDIPVTVDTAEVELASGSGHETINLACETRLPYNYIRASFDSKTATTGVVTVKARIKSGRA